MSTLSTPASGGKPPAKKVDLKSTPVAPKKAKSVLPGKPSSKRVPGKSFAEAANPKVNPLLLTVFAGSDRKARLEKDDFDELMARLNVAWVKEDLDFTPTFTNVMYRNGKGLVLPNDTNSRDWARALIAKTQVEGRRFRAWRVGEDDGFVLAQTILPALFKRCRPSELFAKAAKHLAGGDIEVVSSFSIATGRMVRLSMGKSAAEKIRERNNTLPVGMMQLEIKFRNISLEEHLDEIAADMEGMEVAGTDGMSTEPAPSVKAAE